MPQYVVLGSWTEEGIKNVKHAPQRAEAFRTAVEAAGGKMALSLHTMGPYDIVTVLELPSDEVANDLALRFGQQGFVRTVTLKGWTLAEFAKLVEKL